MATAGTNANGVSPRNAATISGTARCGELSAVGRRRLPSSRTPRPRGRRRRPQCRARPHEPPPARERRPSKSSASTPNGRVRSSAHFAGTVAPARPRPASRRHSSAPATACRDELWHERAMAGLAHGSAAARSEVEGSAARVNAGGGDDLGLGADEDLARGERDLRGNRPRCVQEVVTRHDSVHEPDRKRLAGFDAAARRARGSAPRAEASSRNGR